MTIREKYAKFTTETLNAKLKEIEQELKEYRADMEKYHKQGDLEWYRVTEALHDDKLAIYMDVYAAVLGRNGR